MLTSSTATCKTPHQTTVCISDEWMCQHCGQFFSGIHTHLRKSEVKFKLDATYSFCARRRKPRQCVPSKSILNRLRNWIALCQLALSISKLQQKFIILSTLLPLSTCETETQRGPKCFFHWHLLLQHLNIFWCSVSIQCNATPLW